MTHPAPIRPDDAIELGEVVRTIRRGWRAVLGFTMGGALLALAVVLWAPRRYEGVASVVVKAGQDAASGLLSRLGGAADMLGAGGLGVGKSQLETELQVLNSRVLAGAVVDSLKLQARVFAPRGTPSSRLLQRTALVASFEPRVFEFQRAEGGRYRVIGGGFSGELQPGVAGKIPVGEITLAQGELPATFELKFYDAEDAVTRLQKQVSAGKAGGEVARITYHGEDSITAAAVPNTLVDMYLARRKTVDRGTNQKRVEFLTAQVDNTANDLTNAERGLRQYQEKSGVLDAVVVGKIELEQAALVRKALIEVQVEEGAINLLLSQAASGGISGRQLATYPAFLKGASPLTPLVGQLGELESLRQKLLEKRTLEDPEVVAVSEGIKAIEQQFIPMARSYSDALAHQRKDMMAQLDTMQRAIMAIPGAAQTGGRLQRDVLRLSTIYGALQAQLVQARLAAIDEGGDVRQLDVAQPPRKVWFPRPLLTMAIGVLVGFLSGLAAALVLGSFGRWVRDTIEIERATGVPAQRLVRGAPLMVSGGAAAMRTVLVVPLDDSARGAGRLVAEGLMHTAQSRAVTATVLDLSMEALPRESGNGNGANPGGGVSGMIDELESRYGMVVVRLPNLTSNSTVAAMRETRPVLLVAARDRVNRGRLVSAVETLRRLQIPCAGVVMGDADGTGS